MMGMSRQRLRGLLSVEMIGLIALDLCAGMVLGYSAAFALVGAWLNPFLARLVGVGLEIHVNPAPVLALSGAIVIMGVLFVLPRIWTTTRD
jgi:hypothetical protein